MHECCKAVNGAQTMTRSYPSRLLHFIFSPFPTHLLVLNARPPYHHSLCTFYYFSHFIISIISGYPSPTEAKYTLSTRLGHETHKQQGMFPRPYRKTTTNLCDGHRLYNRNQKTYAQIECNLKHATTCSKAVYLKYIPYLGKR